MLKGKHIVLGITGSIAAYKAASLTRLFVKNGAEVKILVTPLAKEFITPVTLATLSRNTVLCDFFNHDNGDWNSHVELGLWSDLFVIAPCTANTIAKMANGICDNLLLTSYLSTRADVMVAPAMDLDMFQHPSTLRNIETIKSYGNIIVEPASGELASGLDGKGRMEEPENILKAVINYFQSKEVLRGKRFVVTAGPTYERIDPVRFVGNFSSGKMGFAIASRLAEAGAEVTLIAGPVHIAITHPRITRIDVVSADEMFAASLAYFPQSDGAIMAAAVADYAPVTVADEKIKSSEGAMHIEMRKNPDIAAHLGAMKKASQRLVGFALETENEESNAQKKIKSKNLDFVVLNSLRDEGAGFQHNTNKIQIIYPSGESEQFGLKSKSEVAADIVRALTRLF